MNIGFIGCGKMGGALLAGMIGAGFERNSLYVYDVLPTALNDLARQTGVQPAGDLQSLVKQVEAIVLCVKPADATAVLSEVRPALSGKLLISIAAGVTLATLTSAAGESCRVVRVMPNTPALIGRGSTAYAPAASVTDADTALVEKIFRSVGIVAQVKETLLDTVTGLSGSGPAYVYVMIEALADGGVRMGLPRPLARELATQTVMGAAEMVQKTGLHTAELRDQVTSPGGTTIAGLEAMENHGVRAALMAAVKAATERSRELGKS